MTDPASSSEMMQLDLQEARGAIAAWKQEYAHVVRILATAGEFIAAVETSHFWEMTKTPLLLEIEDKLAHLPDIGSGHIWPSGSEASMLAALYEVAHHADDECGFMVPVRAAIAKAEGR